ncbi:MAG: hypothetical protein ACTSRG_26650 [Candidatus Helarchaeota archaeon]
MKYHTIFETELIEYLLKAEKFTLDIENLIIGESVNSKLLIIRKLNNEIENSKVRILSLEDNWDGEGSKAYIKETWERAIDFLKQFYHTLLVEHDLLIKIPDIQPSSEGDIDIHWETEKFELLLGIPENPEEPASYYGDDYSDNTIEASTKLDSLNNILITWMKSIL